jgi:hypothetical protein
MTMNRTSRLRRALAWAWRGQQLREARQLLLAPRERRLLEEAKSCQTLAWRALAGLEPLPAYAREAVARPLLLAALEKCRALLQPAPANVFDIFEDASWQVRFTEAGVPPEHQPHVKNWLSAAEHSASPAGTGRRALLLMNAVVERLEQPNRSIRGVYWHRVRVLVAAALLISVTAFGVGWIFATPEGPDLAEGKPWQASSAYPGYTATGLKPKNPSAGAFFCTNEDVEPWLKIDLRRSQQIGGATVVNRGDCCVERAPPLIIELSSDGQQWREVARTTDKFRTWKVSFKPSQARYVRLRSLRRTFLHLKDVRIHPPAAD